MMKSNVKIQLKKTFDASSLKSHMKIKVKKPLTHYVEKPYESRIEKPLTHYVEKPHENLIEKAFDSSSLKSQK